MDNLHADRLRAFLAVAREGGFSRGARSLGRSQSAISQAVGLLEAELGEMLFVRDGRRVSLTEAGRVLLPRVERAFAELTQAASELAALRELTRGHLVLGTTDTLATYLLPPVFRRFRADYPGIDLELVNRTSPALAQLVVDRRVDLAVASLPLPDGLAERVRAERLSAQREVAICPPGHPLAHRRRVDLATLARYPLLLLDRTTASRARIDARFADLQLAPRVVMEMASVEVLKRLVELDFGVSIVPAMAAARELEAGSLVAIDIRGLGGAPAIGLYTPVAGPLSPAARAFIDRLRAI